MQRPWNSLRRFLSLPTRPRTIVRPRPMRQRLCLESLEDRVVPTVVYNSALGGDSIFWVSGNSAGKPANQVQTSPISNNPSVLNSTTVYLDFWGNSWNETNTAPLANDAQSIIQSNFFSQLSDYGFKGTISYGGYTIDNTETSDGNTGDPQNGQNTKTELQNLLNGKLSTDTNLPTSSWLRPQDNKPQDSPIYIVVYDNGSNAFNTPASYTSSLKMNEISIGDSQGTKDLFTDLFSHEMAERISAGDGTGIEMDATNANTDGEYQNAQISDNEPDDGNYTYRINGENGQLVQAYWSLTYNGFVVPDGNSQTVYLNPVWQSNPSLRYTGTCGLVVNGGQLANPDDIITLGETQNDGISVSLNGQLFQFDDVFINNITINTDQASSTVNVLATPAGTSTYIADQGYDDVVLGNTNGNIDNREGYLGNIKGLVAVAANGDIGEQGATFLFVDDSGDSIGQNVTMYDGQIDFGNAAPIYYDPSSSYIGDVTYLAVYGGSGGNSFNVQNTSDFLTSTLLDTGAGNDNVYVYATKGALHVDNPGGDDNTNVGGGNTGSINGSVEVYGGGSTSLFVTDNRDTTGRTVTMYDGSLFGLGSGGIYWSPTSSSTGGVTYVQVDGGSGFNTFNVDNTSNLYYDTFLNTGTGGGAINIYAIQGGLSVDNPGGFDLTDVGMGNMGSINGFVDVYGPGSTSLTLDDSNDSTSRTVTMNDGSVTGMGGGTGTISWTPSSSGTGGVTGLYVDGSEGGSTYDMNNTSNFYNNTNLYTGYGNDTVNIHATKGNAFSSGLYVINQGGADSIDVGLGSVANINGFVYSYGYGSTALLVDDHLDSTSRTATLATVYVGQLSGLGNAGIITYASGVTALTIDGPSKASTYNIQSTPSGIPVTVNGGVGNDTFNLGSGNSLGGIQGALTINGGGGANYLNANDSSSTSGQSYTLSSTQLAGSDFATITYASLHQLNVTGSGNDTLTLLSPVPTAAITFNGGSGANTLQGANATNVWYISGANSGTLHSVTFSNFQNLVGGTGSDLFNFTTSTASVSGTINGGTGTNNTNTISYATLGSSYLVNGALSSNTAGAATAIGGGFSNINSLTGSTNTNNTLTGPNGTNYWVITGNNAGYLNTGPTRDFFFTGTPHLVGGTGVDDFRFNSTSGNAVGINGGGAPSGQGDWLNYSLFPSSSTATVNLATGSATNVNGGAAGAVSNIQNVLGSATGTNNLTGDAQGNILIGGSGLNTLTDGSGSSLLIGGSGQGSITGGSGTDILIAGATTNNASTTAGEDALMAILAELQSADTFAQKVSDIVNGNTTGGGSDLNGGNKLTWGGTVRASSGTFALSGDTSATAAADWFFSNSSSTVEDFNDDGVQDEHNNNAIGTF